MHRPSSGSADSCNATLGLALAHTGPIAVRDAQVALEESGARVRLRRVIDDTLDDVRTSARDGSLPADAGTLLRSLADAVESRVP